MSSMSSMPHLSFIKKTSWRDSEGRYWKFGSVEDDGQMAWVYGNNIEEIDYLLFQENRDERIVSVNRILDYRRVRSGGFKIAAMITIN